MTGGIYFTTAGTSGSHLHRAWGENERLLRDTPQSALVGTFENNRRTSDGSSCL